MAILAADLAGYSRLVRSDEEGTRAEVRRCIAEVFEPKVAAHHGRIFKTMGDGLLAEFSSVVNAVRCAVEIQTALAHDYAGVAAERRFDFRIGVHVGDVIAEGDDLHGDGVNVAARIEAVARPGAVCISEDAFRQVETRIDFGFEDAGPQRLKNIDRPVRVYHVTSDAQAPGRVFVTPATRLRRWKWPALAVIVAAITLFFTDHFGIYPIREQSAPADRVSVADRVRPLPDRPSIAVLPFQNKSKSGDQAYLADGITDDIITELAKTPGLLVIARESTFRYRDASSNLTDLAMELRVRYVVRGSVRRSQDQIRINATLIDTTTMQHIWGDRYDGRLVSVFSLQDMITEKIVTALSLKLGATDVRNRVRPATADPQAYELFLRGRDLFLRFSKQNTYNARTFYEQAIARDPNFSQAYAMLAWTYAFEYTNGWSDMPEPTLARSLEMADKAIALDDRLPVAYFVKGLVFRERRDYVAALAEAHKAIDIDANYANGYIMLATILYYAGRPKEGLAMIEKAEKVNPIHPSNYPFHKGQALFILKRYDEAIDAFEKGLQQNPTSQRLRVWLAVTYAQAGRMEDASFEAEQVLMEDPDFKLGRLTHIFPFKAIADREHFNIALRKVGFENRW